ncbi:MAG: histidine phosphatase family protein [Lachnospiraceae bacterium]|nr:histidine phosphatase family protein [Lachnospiraceae bacterium]
MISFYIVRHGETLLNRLNRAQGWSDSPLTDNGKKAAIELGNAFQDIKLSAAYTSDTVRAAETARLILSNSGNDNVKVQTDKRLREWCLGSMEAENNAVFIQSVSDWLGVSSFTELNERLPDVSAAIQEHDTTGMAESFADISDRLKGVLEEIVQNESNEEDSNILIVTHAFAIKTLFYLFAPEQLCAMNKIKNTAVSKLDYDGGRFYFPEIIQ